MTSDACRDWRGSLASAALGRLEPAEEIALRAHLDGCPACRAELAELHTVVSVLPSADLSHLERGAVEPAGTLGDLVIDSVARERENRRRQRFRRAGTSVLAAAAVIAIVVAVVAVSVTGGSNGNDRPHVRVEFTATGEGVAS